MPFASATPASVGIMGESTRPMAAPMTTSAASTTARPPEAGTNGMLAASAARPTAMSTQRGTLSEAQPASGVLTR